MANQLEALVLKGIKSAYEADKAQAVTLIAGAEGGLETFIDNAIENYKPANPEIAMLYSLLKPQAIAFVKNELATTSSPEAVYEIIDNLLAKELAAAGV